MKEEYVLQFGEDGKGDSFPPTDAKAARPTPGSLESLRQRMPMTETVKPRQSVENATPADNPPKRMKEVTPKKEVFS